MASSYGQDASKSALRAEYLTLCKNLPRHFTTRVDKSVCTMLRMLDLYRTASLVLAYVSFHEEIDTLPIIRNAFHDGKRVALPVLGPHDTKLRFYEITSTYKVQRGGRGLLRPPTPDAQPLGLEDFLGSVCLVPGLVFDAEGYRVGYGAGYYDEFLQFYPGNKVGLVRSVQVSSNPLPHNDHDLPVDVLVTEGSVWRCRQMPAMMRG